MLVVNASVSVYVTAIKLVNSSNGLITPPAVASVSISPNAMSYPFGIKKHVNANASQNLVFLVNTKTQRLANV